MSTQPGVSKNDPLGPAPANPDGAAIFNLDYPVKKNSVKKLLVKKLRGKKLLE